MGVIDREVRKILQFGIIDLSEYPLKRMTPVELPYVPILLNETFITALWDTGAEKSFISEEVYRNYFSYRPRQKTKDRVVTAQGAPCSHLDRVELQIRIREFQKPWEFHILDNMQYQCILGIDFMKASRLTLDFDQKSLIIPDNLIKQVPKEEKPVDIDLTESKLDDEQQRQLKALFNNFKGLFSDQPGLTHVVYHEIDTGDKGPVVSRPYKYDRVKQGIIDYHIDKMLRDGTICPINSPYASPVVLTRKKNDLPPDSPEAYRFAIDYRKLNGITKYPRYPFPVIDDLLTNIPHTNVMSTLDLRSGYFQLAISPRDIEKTAFITRNGTFAFLRMPFGLSGAAPNFQRAIDIILKPVIGRFVLVYMDDVIITSPSFKDHLDHLTQFNLFTDASGVGIGAVLQQNQKPIAFASRTLNKAERNYTVTERECLAVIWALNKFKTYFGPLPVKVITDHAALTKLTNGKNLSSRMIRWALKLSEFNIEWEHRPGVQNVVADLLSRNPVDSVEGSQISCAALRALAINSREQFIKEQREDPELGHIYRYLENPDDGSVNATVCESWSQDFKLINGLLFYAKYFSNLGELRVYIPGSLRKDIMKEFHDLPLAGHLGKRKTYLKLPRYGAPISLISDNGPQFISDVFEHLSHRLDIKHMKTVTYRPQSNLTERVNRNLVQMIASFVEENHENWDQFLHEFAFALRTAVNETTNKTPAELFLGRKIITPFSKLINVTEDAKYVGRNIERLFDEARRNMQKKHKSWEKHYNLRRRDVHIKVNVLVLLQTHFLSAAGRKQVGKCMPKFEGPYKVLEIKGNNLVIWKNGRNITVNIDQVRVYRPRQSDTISSDSPVETLYDEQEESEGVDHGRVTPHGRSPRNKRKINSTASKDQALKRSKICRKRSRQGSEHQDWKRRAPEHRQGVKRSIPSSVSSRNYKFQKHNTSSPGVESIAGPSRLPDRRTSTTTGGSRMAVSGRDNQTRQTRATTRGRNKQAEKPVRSNQATTRRPCPYYLRSRIQENDGIPEELSNIEINVIPHSALRRSLSMEALDGDPVNRI
ncbi:retrovirus-related Pol polyprotein from transposon 297 [Trichonephila clavipes]|nr:retrovirus-related Pol polyprotein from transposon 297 [Trichonephila clavipes]